MLPALLLAALGTCVVVLQAAPTVLSFTSNDDANWSDGIAHDGEGGSSGIPGITIQVSNISDTSGTQLTDRLIVGHAELGDGFFALTTYDGPSATGAGWKGMQVASQGGSDFQIDGFEYWNYGETSAITISVVGYRDGQQVASTSFQTTLQGYFHRATVTLDATFDAVDVVRLYGTGTSWHGINAIAIDDAIPPNVAPTVGGLHGDSVSFTEGGTALLLDAGGNATVTDSDSANFDTGNVTVAVVANRVSAEDVLGIVNQGTGIGQIGVAGANVTYGSTTIGAYTGGTGTNDLVVTLNANATPTSVQALVRHLTYVDVNTTDPSTATRTVRVTVNDGDGGVSTQAEVGVSVTAVNDAPTLSATGGTPTFTENGSAVDLFGAVSISTVESGQTVSGLTLSVTSVADGAAETLQIDGSSVALTNGNVVLTAMNGVTASVSVAGATATVSLVKAPGLSSATAQTLIDGLGYRNTSDTPTTTSRVVTITSVTDSGGTANGGANTTVVSAAASVTIVAQNDAPVVANAIPNQNATEDAAFVVQFAANTFSDPENDTVTYSAQLNGGGALPAWLSFAAATRTFSGTPANGDVGTVSVDVTADDGNGGTVTDTFNIVVANTNDAPTIANAIADQFATEDAAFNFQFAVNTFADQDAGATLTYAAQLSGGGALPAWLSFDAVTRTFSGTPANADVGTISLDVTAADGNGGVVVDTFALAVANTNDAPTVANAIPNQNATEDAAFVFQFAANTFNDADNDGLSYTAQLNGGGTLPDWLSFNAATRTLSGTPANGDVGTLGLDVIASDGNGGTVTDTFNIVVANTNDAPTVANAIPDQNATEDAAFNFQFAANVFADVDAGATLTYTAHLAGGGALPAWVSFDGVTRTFSGTPANGDAGSISIDVTADDGNGGTVTDTYALLVSAVNDAPVLTVPVSLAVTEDTTTALSGISVSDVDAGGASLTLTFSVGSGTLAASSGSGVIAAGGGTGAVTLAGAAADLNAFVAGGGVSFTPAQNATANVVLSIAVDDGGNTGADPGLSGTGSSEGDVATATLTVSSVNDPPINAVPGPQTVPQDGALVFSSGNGNGVAITDVDAGGNDVQVTLTGSQGLLALSGTTGLSFIVGSGVADGTMTFTGTLADVNAALQGLVFSPASGYHGAASLQITTSDQGFSGAGGTQTDADSVAITVAAPNPIVTSVSSSSVSGTYKVGDSVTATVTFDQNVTVDTGLGAPTLLLETGSTDRMATYAAGSGSQVLLFSYTVQAGDSSGDLDYVSTTALALNGATIRGGGGLDAILTLPTVGGANSLAGQRALVIDGVAPGVTTVTVPADATYVTGQTLDFTVNVSETVTVDTAGGLPRLVVSLDTGTAAATYLSGSGTTSLVFRMIVQPGQEDRTGVALAPLVELQGSTMRDAAGNAVAPTLQGVAPTGGVRVDARGPIVSSVAGPAAGTYGLGQALDFTVTWSEPVVVTTSGGVPTLEVIVDEGPSILAQYVATTGGTTMLFRGTVSPGQGDATGVAVAGLAAPVGAVEDANGNPAVLGLSNVASMTDVLVDADAPGVTIAAPSVTSTSRGPVAFAVTYTGATAVTLTTADVTVVSTGTATGTVLVSGAGAAGRVVTLDQVSGAGTLAIRLAAGTAVDAGGNTAPASATSAAVQVVARQVTSVAPTSGLATGGVMVVMRGVGFSGLVAPSVIVGGQPARSVDVAGDGALQFVTPELPAGGAVDVTLLDGVSAVQTLTGAYTPLAAPTSPAMDSDGDSLPDAWELRFGLDALDAGDALADPDGDGHTSLAEAAAGTHPRGLYRRGLAEGVATDTFATTLALFNPGVARASVVVEYLPSGGAVVRQAHELAPAETIRTDARSVTGLAPGAFATWVESDRPIAAEGLTSWDATRYGAGGEHAVAPAATWYLAEGSTVGAFDLFYLLANPTDAEVAVDVTFLRPSPAPAIVQRHVISARTRLTLWVDTLDPQLASTDVSAVIRTVGGASIIVERAMYRHDGSERWGDAGHRAAGVSQPSVTWHFAEGVVGAPFDTYLLVANPQAVSANVDVEVFGTAGWLGSSSHTVAAHSRLTLAAGDLGVADGPVAFTVRSTNGEPVVAERAMWWPPSGGSAWAEAHASAGQAVGARTWALADLRVGGAASEAQYLLLQNLEPTSVDVELTVYLPGAAGSVVRTVSLPAHSRLSLELGAEVPEAVGVGTSAVVRANGAIVVEASRYWNVDGRVWAAGITVAGTPLP